MTEIAVRFSAEPKCSRYFIGSHLLAPVADLLPVTLCQANGRLRRAPLAARDEYRRATMTLDRVFNAVVILEGEPCGVENAAARVCDAIREAHAAQTGAK
jgi:hypothetical protein